MFGNKTGSKTAEEMHIKATHNQLGTLKDGGGRSLLRTLLRRFPCLSGKIQGISAFLSSYLWLIIPETARQCGFQLHPPKSQPAVTGN